MIKSCLSQPMKCISLLLFVSIMLVACSEIPQNSSFIAPEENISANSSNGSIEAPGIADSQFDSSNSTNENINTPDIATADLDGPIISIEGESFIINVTQQADIGDDTVEAVALGDEFNQVVTFDKSTVIKILNIHQDSAKDNFTSGCIEDIQVNRYVTIWGTLNGETFTSTTIVIWRKIE